MALGLRHARAARPGSSARKESCGIGSSGAMQCGEKEVLEEGLEPSRLAAYAPQTYVSAISPLELFARAKCLAGVVGSASVSLRIIRVHGRPFAVRITESKMLRPRTHGSERSFD